MRINKFKRIVEGKTDYRARLKILLAGKSRVVIRKSLNNILIQLVEYDPSGDKIISCAHSTELKKIGWKFNNGNIPSAYLTGFLFGNKLKKKGRKNSLVLDIGLNKSIKGSRIYAALKGIVDAGVDISCSKDIFPTEDRIKGKHISIKIEKEFEDLKKKIIDK